MSDHYAFQASPELAAAVLARVGEIEAFNRDVIGPANERLHPNEPLFSASIFSPKTDGECVGFNDGAPDEPAPSGLLRAKTRVALVPRKGKSGDVWRDEIEALNRRPRLGDVFADFGIEFAVMGPGAVHRPAMLIDEDNGTAWFRNGAVWFRYAVKPRESEHMLPRKVSEFFAAAEALDARTERAS